MPKKDVERQRIRISVAPPADSSIEHLDEVFIVITQAYCPKGHNLIEEKNEAFDGYPGIRIRVAHEDETADVILSPFHGDASKKGKTDWPDGVPLLISCPICGEPMPKLANCRCDGSGDLVKIFLTEQLSDRNVLGICNIWSCPRSRTIDNWQIISEYLDGQIED